MNRITESVYAEGLPMQLVNSQQPTLGGAHAVPKLGAPIVLVHGLCGFDRLYAFRRTVFDYFPGVRELLEGAGNRVYAARVSATAGVADRARDLKQFLLREVPPGPVHVIGHSMGGLDARFMIAKLGM